MKRRVFTTEGVENKAAAARQVLVTYYPESDDLHVALRTNDWDTWSRPLTFVRADDDAEPTPDVATVTVTLTRGEAVQLYASAASYEASVQRVVDNSGAAGERVVDNSGAAEVAAAALDKLAGALHPGVGPESEPNAAGSTA